MSDSTESPSFPKSGLYTLKAERFEWHVRNEGGYDKGLQIITEDRVWIRIVEYSGRLKIMLEVGEDTTTDHLRRAIPLALSWRDKLLEYQGPWLGGGNNEALEWFRKMIGGNTTYSKLAARQNEIITDYLKEYLQYERAYLEARHSFKTWGDFDDWQYKVVMQQLNLNPFSLEHAKGQLEMWRFSDSEINNLLKAAIENLRAGEPAFPPQSPVTAKKVRTVLDTWRRSKKGQIAKKKEEEREAEWRRKDAEAFVEPQDFLWQGAEI